MLLALPAHAQTVVQGTVKIAAQAQDPIVAGQTTSGVDYVQFAVNGVDIGPRLTGPYEYQWDSTSRANGVYTLSARAVDRVGNIGTAQLQIEVRNPIIGPDTTPPVITIISPIAGQTVNGRVNVLAQATDNTATTRMTLTINGQQRESVNTDALLYQWNTSPFKKYGSVPLVVTAADAMGNTASSSIVVRVR